MPKTCQKHVENMAGRIKDDVHAHFSMRDEKYDDDGNTKERRVAKCDHCGEERTYSNPDRLRRHLTGDVELCRGHGGWPCWAVTDLFEGVNVLNHLV